MTVELDHGTVAQDVRLNECPVVECQIQDVDDRAVLLSVGDRELAYYGRMC